jgi:uncharacterized protein
VRVTVTGASGLIGTALLRALRERGDEVTALSRDPERAARSLREAGAGEASAGKRGAGKRGDGAWAGGDAPAQGDEQRVRIRAWDPESQPAPADSLAGRDAVVHLAGENIARRWTAGAKRAIRDSRELGTRNLVQGIRACAPEQRPRVLVSASAIGYYGPHGDEPIDEEAPAGGDFLAQMCVAWEAQALAAEQLGVRVVLLRNGVVLDARGGALGKMLPPFRLGVGGPVAGGRQYVAWVHVDDVVGMALSAIADRRWSGPVNATAPDPVTNRVFSKTLARVLRRPAVLPVPAAALRVLYGEMAKIVTTGARVLPAKALVLGYEFRHPQLEPALRAGLNR